jgi:hypothetical protein
MYITSWAGGGWHRIIFTSQIPRHLSTILNCGDPSPDEDPLPSGSAADSARSERSKRKHDNNKVAWRLIA